MIRRIIAQVTLTEPKTHQPNLKSSDFMPVSKDRLQVFVKLSAEDSQGRQITSDVPFGLQGPKRGVGAIWWRYHGPSLPDDYVDQMDFLESLHRVGLSDIEDGINMMLGRDPDLPSPPILAWMSLRTALSSAGIHLTDRDLISIPLCVQFDGDVIMALQEA